MGYSKAFDSEPILDPPNTQYRIIEKYIEHSIIAESETSNKGDEAPQNLTKETRSRISSLIAIRSFIQERDRCNF
jgi:hypothetical protein